MAFQLNTGTHFLLHQILERTADLPDRLIANRAALALCNLHSVAVFGAALCMTMISVERHLATVWVADYEGRSKKVGLILMTVVVSAVYFIVLYCI